MEKGCPEGQECKVLDDCIDQVMKCDLPLDEVTAPRCSCARMRGKQAPPARPLLLPPDS